MRLRYGLAVLILVGAVGYYAHARDLFGRLARYQQRQQQVEDLRKQLRMKEEDRLAVERRVHGLASDPVEIEAAIREAEKKVRQGETIYRIERGVAASGVSAATAP